MAVQYIFRGGPIDISAKLSAEQLGGTAPLSAVSCPNCTAYVSFASALTPGSFEYIRLMQIMKSLGYDFVVQTPDEVSMPGLFVSGLRIAKTGALTLKINIGGCIDDLNAEMMYLPYPLDLDLGAVGKNGRDHSSSIVNHSWYYVFLISKSAAYNSDKQLINVGEIASLASTSKTNPTMPPGFTRKRRIGVIRTNGAGNILDFTQSGPGNERYVEWANGSNHVLKSGKYGNTNWNEHTYETHAPSGSVRLLIRAQYFVENSATDLSVRWLKFRPKGSANDNPIWIVQPGFKRNGVDPATPQFKLEVPTGIDDKIEIKASNESDHCHITIDGFVDEI